MKKISNLIMSVLLIMCFTVAPLSVNAVEDNDVEIPQTIISSEAGKYGYYSYDVQTGETSYVPASAYAGRSGGIKKVAPVIPDSIGAEESEGLPEELDIEDLPPEMQTQLRQTQAMPRRVVGADDRILVRNLDLYQYASTCIVLARYENGTKDYGTGFLIGNNYLATVGHLAYKEDAGWAKHFGVYSGASGGKYFKYSLGYRYDVGGDYIANAGDSDPYARKMYDDWAIVHLDTSMGDRGYMGLWQADSASDFGNDLYSSQGYPKNRNEGIWGTGEYDYQNYNMYYTEGHILGNAPGPQRYLPVVEVDMDVTAGQSGSPVYTYSDGGQYVRGIVVAGGRYPTFNMVILINEWLFNRFMQVRDS